MIKCCGMLFVIWNEVCNFNVNGYGIFVIVNEMDGFGYGVDG